MPHTRPPALCQTEGGGLYVLGMSPAARTEHPQIVQTAQKRKYCKAFSLSRRSKQESWRVGRIPAYWLSLQPIDYFISQLLIWLAISYSLS